MRIVAIACALLATALPLSGQSAPRVATSLSGTELAELEAVRRAVWMDWFSGDTAALGRVLGPELVAISADAPHWQSLEESLAASARFQANGGKLVSLSFDSTLTHRFGETVVMFSHYTLVTESGEQRQTRRDGPPRCSFARAVGGCTRHGT